MRPPLVYNTGPRTFGARRKFHYTPAAAFLSSDFFKKSAQIFIPKKLILCATFRLVNFKKFCYNEFNKTKRDKRAEVKAAEKISKKIKKSLDSH